MRKARDHGEYTFLFAKFQIGLKTYQIKHRAGGVFTPQLHCRPRTVPGFWIRQPHGFHGPETRCVRAALGEFFNRHTAFIHIKIMEHGALRIYKFMYKIFVLLFIERAVQIITVAAPAVAGRAENDIRINTFRRNDGRGGIVKGKVIAAEFFYALAHGAVRQGAGCNDGDFPLTERNVRDLLADHGNIRVGTYLLRYSGGKHISVHRKGAAGGNRAVSGNGNGKRAETRHFFFQQTRGGIQPCGFQRIGTHEFCKIVRPMSGGFFQRFLLKKRYLFSGVCDLPRSLRACKTCAYHIKLLHDFSLFFFRVAGLVKPQPSVSGQ